MKQCIIILLFSSIAWSLCGQDLHFSQYHSAPLHLNPAMTGVLYDGNVITLNYRSQWAPILGGDAFKTIAGTFEKRINLSGVDYFGGGVSVWQDKAGALKQNEAKIALSYGRIMAKKGKAYHYLLGGGQMGATQQTLDVSDRRWLSQYDGNGGFDPSKRSETIDFTQKTILDASMGISVYGLYDNKNYYVIGGAVHHLNRGDISLTQYSTNPLQYMRYTAHFTGSFNIGNSQVRLVPSTLMMKQGPSFELTTGVAVKWVFDLVDYRSFQIGTWSRIVNKPEKGLMNDAYFALVRIDWGKYGLGFSYDFNVSNLNVTNRRNNSIELALSYRFGSAAWNTSKMVTPRYFD